LSSFRKEKVRLVASFGTEYLAGEAPLEVTGGNSMFRNIQEHAWLYRRGRWSRIKNPFYTTQSDNASESLHWRKLLRDYAHIWSSLGPTPTSSNYASILVFIYSYTGKRRAPQYLIRVTAIGMNEIIYTQDFPDLLELLLLLAPIVSAGILSDVYMQTQRR
jgi:hypothetical protein